MTYPYSRNRAWTRDNMQVLALGRDLVAVGVLASSTDVVDYFTTPYNWRREHEWWMAHGCTDDPEAWAQAGMT